MWTLAAAAIVLAAPGTPSPTLPLYIGGGGAPRELSQRVDERLRAVLAEKMPVVAEPIAAPGPEARLAEAIRDLERGVKAYQKLALEEAVPALQSAEKEALAAAASAEATGVLVEARTHLGLIALATGRTADADRAFRLAAVLDPARKLDDRLHPPEVVTAYEKMRRAVVAGPQCDLILSSSPPGASITVDGRGASDTVRVPHGEHLVQASLEDHGAAGLRVELAQPRATVSVELPVSPTALAAAVRAAVRRNDEASIGAAADALAAATGAKRILLWDLRSAAGRVEAPMRMRDTAARAFTGHANADLGTAATVDVPLRRAVADLFGEAPAAVAQTAALPKGPSRPRTEGTRKLPGWIWWAAGSVALAAAGGAAAYSYDPPGAGRDEVVVVVEK